MQFVTAFANNDVRNEKSCKGSRHSPQAFIFCSVLGGNTYQSLSLSKIEIIPSEFIVTLMFLILIKWK